MIKFKRKNKKKIRINKEKNNSLNRIISFCDLIIHLSTGLGILITVIKPNYPKIPNTGGKFSPCQIPYLIIHSSKKETYLGVIIVYGFILGLLFISSNLKYSIENKKNPFLLNKVFNIIDKIKNRFLSYIILFCFALFVGSIVFVVGLLLNFGLDNYVKYGNTLLVLFSSFLISCLFFYLFISIMYNSKKDILDFIFEDLVIVVSLILLINPVWIIVIMAFYVVAFLVVFLVVLLGCGVRRFFKKYV